MELSWYKVFRLSYRDKEYTIFSALLFGLATIVFQSSAPLMGKVIFDKALAAHNYHLILNYGIIWLALLSAASISEHFYHVSTTEADTEAVRKLRTATLRAVLLKFRKGAGAGKKKGEFLSHILTDTQRFIDNAGIGCIIAIVIAAVSFVIVTIVTLILDWPMATLCLAGTTVSLALQYRAPGRLQRSNQKIASLQAYTTSVIENIIAAWSTIVRHQQIEKEVTYLNGASVELSNATKSAKRKMYVAQLQNSLLVNAIPIILVWIGAFRMASGKIGLGTLIAFVSYLYLMNGSLSTFFQVGLDVFSGFGQAKEFRRILSESASEDALTGHYDQLDSIDSIVIKNMTLSAGKLVVKASEINLSRGETYLLTGDSGVGKSTFLEFLAGIRKADQAEVYVNRRLHDADCFLHVARHFGYVRKEDTLLDRSVPENIYGLSESNLNTVEHYAKILKMDYFSRDSVTGLSAGEKQRVAFVRELVREPKVFIIDEGIDSLDLNLKIDVLALIREFLPKSIMIVCTHNWQNNVQINGRLVVSNGYVRQENGF